MSVYRTIGPLVLKTQNIPVPSKLMICNLKKKKLNLNKTLHPKFLVSKKHFVCLDLVVDDTRKPVFGVCEADLRLGFRIGNNLIFSGCGSKVSHITADHHICFHLIQNVIPLLL